MATKFLITALGILMTGLFVAVPDIGISDMDRRVRSDGCASLCGSRRSVFDPSRKAAAVNVAIIIICYGIATFAQVGRSTPSEKINMRTRYQCMAIALMCCSISVMAAAAASPLALTPAASIEIPHSTGKFDFLRVDSKRHRLMGVDHVYGR